MNLQTIFSTVKNHLLKQNKQSRDENLNCVYYHDEGLRCAVGCLIKPSAYNSSIELQTPEEKILAPVLRKSGVFIANESSRIRKRKKELLMQLQYLHDLQKTSYWELGLKKIAKQFKLHY